MEAPSIWSGVRAILAIAFLRNVPFWRQSLHRRIARRVLMPTYLYVAALLVLLALEDRMLYPGATAARPWVEPPEYLHVREQLLTSATGDKVHCWFTAPDGWKPEQGAIHLSHGNGSNLSRIHGRAYR